MVHSAKNQSQSSVQSLSSSNKEQCKTICKESEEINQNFWNDGSQSKTAVMLYKGSEQGRNVAWPRENACASERSPSAILISVHT